DLLDPPERDDVLVQWNATTQVYGEPRSLATLFEAQAEARPHAIAVTAETTAVSYAALARRVTQVAAALRAAGVGPERRVAVCLERGIDLVVALLAVLEADGAYVPLEPAYPPARLAELIDDAQPTVVDTHSALRERLPAESGPVLLIDRVDSARAVTPRLASRVRGSQLAYIIYTSGSTGRPK